MVQLVDQHPGLSFLVFMFGEVDERGKILNNITALISNRADEEGGPKLAAILAVVTNFRPVGRTLKLGFNLRQRLGIGGVRHNKVEALAEHLFPAVPGQGEKAVVGENYRIVELPGIGKHHRHARCFAGDHEGSEVFAKGLDFGLGKFLLFGLVSYFRHAADRSGCVAAKVIDILRGSRRRGKEIHSSSGRLTCLGAIEWWTGE